MMNGHAATGGTLTWRLTFQWVVAIVVTCLLAFLTYGIAYTVRGLSGLLFAFALGLAVWWWVKARRGSLEAPGHPSSHSSPGGMRS